jgi:hypothetical protein
METVVRHHLTALEGFRVESAQGLLGWVEETWLGDGDEPVAFAVRTTDGRDGLLPAEDVERVDRDREGVFMRDGARLLELEVPRIETASANGLAATWRTTGDALEPVPEPPGFVDRALLGLRPWRLAPPPRPESERPMWFMVTALYGSLALIVLFVIGLCFLIAQLVAGQAV